MELNKFIQLFSTQFDETDQSIFNANTEYQNLDEWSSLTALSIIAMIDEEYNVKIKGEDIRKSMTIKNLFDIVISRMC